MAQRHPFTGTTAAATVTRGLPAPQQAFSPVVGTVSPTVVQPASAVAASQQPPSSSGSLLHTPVSGRSSRSEEHTSELQSLMRISYAVFCLKKKKTSNRIAIGKYTSTTLRHDQYRYEY